MASIGIFDSGVGGFTILKAVHAKLPGSPIIYVADQANIPYAAKSAGWLTKRSQAITEYLMQNGCSTIVIACNTATVSAIGHLRTRYPHLQFVGVEPAIKPASLQVKSGKILILATRHTLQSRRLKELCLRYAGQKSVIFQDMPEWVTIAEKGNIHGRKVQAAITASLQPFKDQNIQAVVLACTHYPFFKPWIRRVLPQAVIFDPSLPVANQVKKVHQDVGSDRPQIILATTGSLAAFKATAANLLPFPAKIQSIVV